MARHRITSATNDFYTGGSGLSEDALRGSFAVLSNDPVGARLFSVQATLPRVLGTSASSAPRPISIVDGAITYTGLVSILNGRAVVDFSQSGTALNALNAGDLLTGSFFYVDRLANGRFSSAKVTFTIRGINDTATISGTSTGSVTENGTSAATGMLTVTDPDAGENTFQTPSFNASPYGTFSFDPSTGGWRFDLNNASPDVQSLDAGEQVDVGFSVTSLDGTATQTITVTINGAEDGAVITGDDQGTVTEDGTLTDSGTLSVTDADAGEAGFQTPSPASLAGTFGTFTFNAVTGVWGYTLNNTAANVQGLITGENASDVLSVTSSDGSDSETIFVTIRGADDVAVITGKSSDTVSEDGVTSVSGTLNVADPDAGQASFQIPNSLAGTYGDFSFSTGSGEWDYTLRNGDENVQALITGQQVQDTLQVNSLDGSDSETITITVEGQDDPATFGGDLFGVVHEDNNSGSSNASGTVTVTDPDLGEATFLVADPVDLEGDYGTFTFNKNTGGWTYTLHNLDPIVDSLNDEGQLQDFLTVTSFGFSTVQIQIDIFGHYG